MGGKNVLPTEDPTEQVRRTKPQEQAGQTLAELAPPRPLRKLDFFLHTKEEKESRRPTES